MWTQGSPGDFCEQHHGREEGAQVLATGEPGLARGLCPELCDPGQII